MDEGEQSEVEREEPGDLALVEAEVVEDRVDVAQERVDLPEQRPRLVQQLAQRRQRRPPRENEVPRAAMPTRARLVQNNA